MKIVGFQGIRGGTGTTSMVSMVADALYTNGQSVLMIDLSPSDMLKLHFNVPYLDQAGWAYASALVEPWHAHAYEIAQGLTLIPYGRKGVEDHYRELARSHDPVSLSWLSQLRQVTPAPDWVLLDLPHTLPVSDDWYPVLDLHLLVTSVDVACHTLLTQYLFQNKTRILANMQDPSRLLSNDLIVEWEMRFQDLLTPMMIQRDESVHEALALKTPVTKAFPGSKASLDAHSLASWLQIRNRRSS